MGSIITLVSVLIFSLTAINVAPRIKVNTTPPSVQVQAPEKVEASVIPEKKQKPVKQAEKRPKPKAKKDPNGCEAKGMWYRKDNNKCIPKTTAAKKEAPRPTTSVPTRPALTGSCASWMAQAGVPNIPAAHALIGGESGCNPYAVNPSSGACGIPQDINGCTVGHDPVAQLKWMDNYIRGRYGSWENAYSTWLSRSPHWY